MPVYDISLTITDSLVTWPDSPPIETGQVSHLGRGDEATVSQMSMGTHTGTHVDAPAHFVPGGGTVEGLDLDVLVGPVLVVDARDADVLDAAALDKLAIPAGTERVLFLTRNSAIWDKNTTSFVQDYVALDSSGAQWIVDHAIKLVGIDYLSIAIWSDLVVPHQKLLGAQVVILEGLDLRAITPGTYQLVALPLKLGGIEGAPTRVILIDDAS
jgi:arylformamidase